jgi:hypothetical protein
MATNGDLINYDTLQRMVRVFDSVRITQHSNELPCENIVDEFILKNPEHSNWITVLRPGWLPQNWGGVINNIITYPWESFRKSCVYSFSIIINVFGECILCCQDVLAKYSYGNIKDYTLKELWEKSISTRILLANGMHINNINLCKVCTGLDLGDRKLPNEKFSIKILKKLKSFAKKFLSKQYSTLINFNINIVFLKQGYRIINGV